jgi:D-alanine-D-alanine ligase
MLLAHDREKTVAVLFGGRSSEHEISLRSACFVLRNVPRPWRIIPVAIDRDGLCLSLEGTFTAEDFSTVTPEDLAMLVRREIPRGLRAGAVVESLVLPARREVIENMPEYPLRILNLEAGVFFPVLHGPNGEDGRLQGLFELAEVAYVGCDVRASVLGIDKHIQKRLASEAGINVARYEAVAHEEWGESRARVVERVKSRIGFPCFVKPNALGSAVGCGRAKDEAELGQLLDAALTYDDKALVEEPMTGTEVECAFLGTAVNPRITIAGEIAPADFYSYEAKYLSEDGAAQYLPARLEEARMQELRALAARVATTLGLDGLCRIDFWNATGGPHAGTFVFNEVNTLPGLTSISMFPKLWEHDGVDGPSWIAELLERALIRGKLLCSRAHGLPPIAG